ncbi:MAG TPA: imidazoleglycerol-phosphate dehydratase HisB [Phycisphaerales bacterium]|nr:imidazoleglycerol-phosphate dehydratase HisB [Phycisphaerales bacterium]HCD34684.1 imidazoleglycerol-phosphate dehydratase HisB [Phycisphaerales bacterium]|tara:strand:- start:140 stop:736 length:597 start_codon:yes stop_codon:yes gene_type:complete
MDQRKATITRNTNETQITVEMNLDGNGYTHNTGVGFFDHMLDHVARHGQIALNVQAKGDLHIDDHHTVEDVGIVLGQALLEALGDKKGIERYGFASVPMDEALAKVSLDLSGRFALVMDVKPDAFTMPGTKIGTFDTQLVQEFLNAFAQAGKFNLHVEVPHGTNQHHIAEGIFKALGRALRQAIEVTGDQIPSTKGSL